ncbi:secreted RxLR effector protein 161-like [Cicer arietinum]|uniref:secreted RxLR effector protein 161-like n=1 Tax=Cicer arietinum TaxID=3827 RepID=UPI003CC55BA7
MKKELKAIEKNNTWELMTLRVHKRPIVVKWVYKIKLKPDGQIANYKAKLEGDEELVDPTTFKQMVGSLRYLCNTRLDIAYSVGLLSRYMEKPRAPHYLAAKRILRYIKETSELGLHYARNQTGIEAGLIGFTDSDWCGDKDDRKNNSHYVFLINESLTSWCSRKQSILALSTCEAEYMVASIGACQAIWLAELMAEL